MYEVCNKLVSQILCYEPNILDIVIIMKNYVARIIRCKAISTVTLFDIREKSVYFGEQIE